MLKSILLLSVILFLLPSNANCCPIKPIRISLTNVGEQIDGDSLSPFISGNGKFVLFQTYATNLFPNTVPTTRNVALYSKKNRSSTLVSKNSLGEPGNANSTASDISQNGRFIAFTSDASDLVPNDSNGFSDAFLYDRINDTISRVSLSSAGAELNNQSYAISISANGIYLVWATNATNVTSSDTDSVADVYLYSSLTGQSELISVSTEGVKGDQDSFGSNSAVSSNGRYIAFSSSATNLALPTSINTGGNRSIYLRDRQAGTTIRLNVDQDGNEAVGDSAKAVVSANGKFVGFWSDGVLQASDNNGTTDGYLWDVKKNNNKLITTSNTGDIADQGGTFRHLNQDGSYSTFVSLSTNLTRLGANGQVQAYLKQNKGRFIETLSVNRAKELGNATTGWVMISKNARWATYSSYADNLVENDTNTFSDIFLVRTSVDRKCK